MTAVSHAPAAAAKLAEQRISSRTEKKGCHRGDGRFAALAFAAALGEGGNGGRQQETKLLA